MYISKLVLLRRNEGNVVKDSDVLREPTFEYGLPGCNLRLLYKSHQEGSVGQRNTTANHKIRRISIMCSASDILKPVIFAPVGSWPVVFTLSSLGAKLEADSDKNPAVGHPGFQGN